MIFFQNMLSLFYLIFNKFVLLTTKANNIFENHNDLPGILNVINLISSPLSKLRNVCK